MKRGNVWMAIALISFVVAGVQPRPVDAMIYLSNAGWSTPPEGEDPYGTWNEETKTGTLTRDVTEPIEILSGYITLDGNGKSATGSGLRAGVFIDSKTAVTIRNIILTAFQDGIWLTHSTSCILTGNTVDSNNAYGIYLGDSSDNTLAGNTVSNNKYGVYLYASSGNTLTENNTSNNYSYGIHLGFSDSNTLVGNGANSQFPGGGIWLWNSKENTLTGNTASENISSGIWLDASSGNTLAGNTASNNKYGVYLYASSGNTLTENNTSNNGQYGMCLRGSASNTLCGNTASDNYWEGIRLECASDNNTVTANGASGNQTGICLGSSSNNRLTANTVSGNNGYGMHLSGDDYWGFADNNTVIFNTVWENTYGIFVYQYARNNDIYNNNFINNDCNAFVCYPEDCLDNRFNLDSPIGGNFWSDCTGSDEDGDGFVDSPYTFYGGQDDLPWVDRPFDISLGGVTPTGDPVVELIDPATDTTVVTLDFAEVTEGGISTVTTTTPAENQGPPEGFRVGAPPTIFNISTTATFEGSVTIGINYSGISYQNEADLKLFHFVEGVGWEDVTDWVDTENKIIYGIVTSLSPFAVFEPGVSLEVAVDIKPGSYPNAINLGSQGLVPVAILSSAEFDATSVNEETVELAGAGVAVRGKAEKYMAHVEDVNGDGLLDLVVQVETVNFDPDSFQDGYAVLTGTTWDGQEIEGWDEIVIVPAE